MSTIPKADEEYSVTLTDHRERLKTVLDYIDRNLEDGIDLERLADIACYSRYHFHRIFAAFTGEPPASYVRRKRLERAAREIVDTRRPITQIALDAGYETPTAFTKAFKRLFEITPSTLRTFRYLGSIDRFIRPLTLAPEEILMKPEIRKFEPFTVLQYTAKGLVDGTFTQSAQQAFYVLCDFIARNNLWPSTGRCLGIMPDDPSVTPKEECRFQAALEFRGTLAVPREEGIELGEVGSGRYAIFTHRGPYDRLWETWNKAYRDWLPSSGEEPRDVPPFEIYLNDPNGTKPEDLLTEVCIPLQ